MITPCVSVCKINTLTRSCEGCGRTIEEIRMWSKYTEDERMEVMRRLGYGKRQGREETLRRYDRG